GGAVCYASGFSESEDGKQLQAELVQAAGNMPILGPNCYGLINYLDGALLWPDQHGGQRVKRGVALFTQSSNILLNLTMQTRGLPIAYVLALGNQAQTDVAHAIEAVVADDRVTAVGLHVEGFSDVQTLERVSRLARDRRLPMVAIKAGSSVRGAGLALSHTASLAGSDRIADALLERLGIARVRSLDSLIETLKLLHVHGPLSGSRIGSMSCSGGEAMLMADAAEGRDVSFPEFSPDQYQRVRETLTELVTVSNPLDYHTFNWNDEEKLYKTYRAMLSCGFDLSLLVLDFPRQDNCQWDTWHPAINAIERAAQDTGQHTAILASLPENLPEDTASDFINCGIAPLCGIEQALDAVEAAAKIGNLWRQVPPLLLPGVTTEIRQESFIVDEWEGKAWLSELGLVVPRGRLVRSIEESVEAAGEIGFPVCVKACDVSLRHKSDQLAITLNVSNEQQLRNSAERLLAHYDRLIVEEMITDALVELIIGFEHDPQVGPCMMLGTGGILVELLRDVQIVLLPARRSEFESALEKLGTMPMLKGYRGTSQGDTVALLDCLETLSSHILSATGSVSELDINPMLVRPLGKGVVAADVLLSQFHKPLSSRRDSVKFKSDRLQ
ncbi:MAG: acetate--CoA ligase family protein, partial [Arenicellales bacterium]|nr:acetate--CoA ligase family protein [Arenicellales bacterium]